MPANKAYRQALILKIIRSKPVHTQEQLAQELSQYGIHTTQVTLSRDIRELGLVKTPEGYKQLGPEHGRPRLASAVRNFLQDARVAQNLVVLKTLPAHANAVAAALDQEDWPEVVGTVAGDDTVLVVAPDQEQAERIREKLMSLLR